MSGTTESFTTSIENDIKTITEIKINERGQRIKVIHTYKLPNNIHTIETRKNWKKFGDCTGIVGPEKNITQLTNEDIYLERPKTEEKSSDPWEKLYTTTSTVVCRLCGSNEHMFLWCPKRQTMGDSAIDAKLAAAGGGSSSVPVPDTTGKYVPPNQRRDASGRARGGEDKTERNRDEPSVRVSNLPEEATDMDIRELFGSFGPILRATVVKDKVTFRSKGFAYVNFAYPEDAQKAINKLDKHGYGNLILQVGWSDKKF